ncbi:hypothetical protein [Flavobacterium hiemivividum]|uniref:Uncharacterized protein n=1 Tax=Flavobacterium hiemivividum TaxID=2541734 RepID=A0A4R5D1X7_9FLAO|nr:hypothetical protein [Flavobacterium hiemivividum]TDE06297.1 hypothetical protein E0F98_01375 [Flavobacterium hiemivividum]
MGLQELKQKIQRQLEDADERSLRIVSSVFDNYLSEETPDTSVENSITLQEKKAIDEALIPVEKKQTISHDLVMEETKKKYSKYFKDKN